MGHPGLHPTANHFERVAHRDRGQNLDGFEQGRSLDDTAGMDSDCFHIGRKADVNRSERRQQWFKTSSFPQSGPGFQPPAIVGCAPPQSLAARPSLVPLISPDAPWPPAPDGSAPVSDGLHPSGGHLGGQYLASSGKTRFTSAEAPLQQGGNFKACFAMGSGPVAQVWQNVPLGQPGIA